MDDGAEGAAGGKGEKGGGMGGEGGRKALMQQIVMTSIDSKGYLSVEDARSP